MPQPISIALVVEGVLPAIDVLDFTLGFFRPIDEGRDILPRRRRACSGQRKRRRQGDD